MSTEDGRSEGWATALRRWAAEFVLIVAGVSVALGADSVWEWRQDRQREAEYLAQLSEDLDENAGRLRAAIELEESQRRAAITAFEAVAGGVEVSPDSARSWLLDRRGLYYSDPRLVTGTFTALVSTGDVGLIRDPAIRRAVVGYVPKVQDDMEEFDRWVDRLIEYNAGLRRIGLAVEEAPETTIDRSAPLAELSRGDPSVSALANTRGDAGVLTSLDGVLFTILPRLTYLRSMLDSTTELYDLLEERSR